MAIIRTFGHKWKLQDLQLNPTKSHTLLKYIPLRCWNNPRVCICSIHSQLSKNSNWLARVPSTQTPSDIEIERLHIIDLFVWFLTLSPGLGVMAELYMWFIASSYSLDEYKWWRISGDGEWSHHPTCSLPGWAVMAQVFLFRLQTS